MKNNRLVIISYRLPFSIKTQNRVTTIKPSAGGLVTAVKSLDLSASAEKPIWIGCADFTQRAWEKHREEVGDDFEYVPVFLDKATNKKFYNGFANSVLWPLFHYFPSFVDYHDEYLTAYQAANQAVCQKVLELLRPGDLVWVHDYHFLPLPQLIRESAPTATIGFFLHIPFPSNELLKLLPKPCRNYLLNGLLGADLIGFHTNDYMIHFLQSVQLSLGLPHKLARIQHQDRNVQCQAFPIGINYSLFYDAYDKPEVVHEREDLKKSYPGKIIFSVDRLDYTKGVMQRLDALEVFLQAHPEWKENLVFILVVVPSRDEIQTYWERKQMIEQAVGRINGKFATLTWVPIVYRYASLAFPQLLALYTACDVAMITPLRDGMNLVAKEFIASRQDQRGVLLLSELTGAANELGEALQVNPLDEYEVADQLNRALTMPSEEQRRRMAVMQKRISDYDVKQWAGDFFDSLLVSQRGKEISHVRTLKGPSKQKLMAAFDQAQTRLLLIDYDGTLVEFTDVPDQAAPSVEVIRLLNELAGDPRNKVIIISGRAHQTLDRWLDGLPVDIVAEHGTFIRQEGGWRSSVLGDSDWKETVRPLMNDFVSRCAGSFIEEKTHSLAWHYRNVGEELGFLRSREMVTTLEALLPHQLRVIDGNRVVEVKNADTDKGRMAKQLALASPYEFVLAIGDDRTDEDMFTALVGPNQYTIKVGRGATDANYRLDAVSQVLALLRDFAGRQPVPTDDQD
ncbi:bifunctional alpha,alpha-trehalose-phosphate synthase (UDP-forming)/trehalose-phosphatase [Fibrisoma montanum]|uniref:Bifunctional alpha,alpha-trehalose-phosphate synthase (UDP-forming)/trehalose-phosphatase n=1 Tax=Fibrisoma montanum TaxID=2305895 RepID=A0A418MC09_9BACT|nr:bifunctional alpha,alpha-trehalose-phosphate synthase (UDP-forming)/trehalose-phosphatase [Fibrisoma montanum]RIV23913.1 bifunctional alpha,alpha-trehalose-phosphate synthase (UDP-forming)/trehalose-phosphatase [Fibrisoma montanum]